MQTAYLSLLIRYQSDFDWSLSVARKDFLVFTHAPELHLGLVTSDMTLISITAKNVFNLGKGGITQLKWRINCIYMCKPSKIYMYIETRQRARCV